MSSGLAGLAFGGSGPASPFGGATPFGFEVPQGDPGAIEAAARACRSLGGTLRDQSAALRAAAGIALESDGGWRGQAAGAYAGYSGHVEGVLGSDAAACELAAGALATLSQALAHAQSVTRQALADCTRYQHEMVTQQGVAAQAATEASTASAQAATATHPALQASLARQASEASGRQSTAATAAHAAETELGAAQQRGIRADEAYQEVSRAVTGRLESAASEMREAPLLAGGPAVPITVTQSDVTLSTAMLNGLSLTAAAAALAHPGQLDALACDLPLTPGAALEFLQGFRQRVQMAEIWAQDRPADGSLAGTLGPVGQFIDGVEDGAKSTFNFVTHPGAWAGLFTTLLSTSPGYREAVDGENPVTAQANATQTADGLLKNAVDWQDISHGNIPKALGEFSVGALAAKGVGELASRGASTAGAIWRDSVFDGRPALTSDVGKGLQLAGVPHAGDVADAVAPATPYTRTELTAGARVLPAQVMASAERGAALVGGKLSSVVRGDLARAIVDPSQFTQPVIDAMSKVPADPQIVVVPSHAPPAVVYRYRPAPIVRSVPLARGSRG